MNSKRLIILVGMLAYGLLVYAVYFTRLIPLAVKPFVMLPLGLFLAALPIVIVAWLVFRFLSRNRNN